MVSGIHFQCFYDGREGGVLSNSQHDPGLQKNLNCFWFTPLLHSQWNCISMAFMCLACTLLFIMPPADKLSVCIGIGSCGWPISSRICHISTALHVFMYDAPNSVLYADNITVLIILAILRIAPLFGRKGTFWFK